MNVPVTMPKVGLTIEEAEVIEWYGTAGDTINEGEPLLAVNADKADVVIDAPSSGVLIEITADVGTVVRIGERLGMIDDGADTTPAAPHIESPDSAPPASNEGAAEQPSTSAAPEKVTTTRAGARPHPVDSPTEAMTVTRIRISPYARRLCQERRIDITTVTGSGPHGRIVARDIPATRRSSSRSPATHSPGGSATLMANADAVELLGVIAATERLGTSVGPLHVVAWATSQALQSHPHANMFLDDDGLVVSSTRSDIQVIDSDDQHHLVANASSLMFADLVELLGRPERGTPSTTSATILDLSASRVVAVGQPVEPPSTLLVTVGALDDRTRLSEGRLVTRAAVNISLSYLPDLLTAHSAARLLYSIAANVAHAGEILNSLPHDPR